MSAGFLATSRCLRKIVTRQLDIQKQGQKFVPLLSVSSTSCSVNHQRFSSTSPPPKVSLNWSPTLRDKFLETFTRFRFLQAENLVTPQEELQAYGYFKQAVNGRNRDPQPPDSHLEAIEKWTAWADLRNMSSDEAQRHYINLISEIHERFADEHLRQRHMTN